MRINGKKIKWFKRILLNFYLGIGMDMITPTYYVQHVKNRYVYISK